MWYQSSCMHTSIHACQLAIEYCRGKRKNTRCLYLDSLKQDDVKMQGVNIVVQHVQKWLKNMIIQIRLLHL